MVRVLTIRPPKVAPNTKTYWVEEAACQSLPAEDFAPSLQGRRATNLKANEDKFERARRACSSCPIWHMCYQKATPDDFYYTMRAGIEPVQYTEYKELGRVRYRSGQRAGDENKCKNGHENWRMWGKKRPRRKCVDCDNERQRKNRANAPSVV